MYNKLKLFGAWVASWALLKKQPHDPNANTCQVCGMKDPPDDYKGSAWSVPTCGNCERLKDESKLASPKLIPLEKQAFII